MRYNRLTMGEPASSASDDDPLLHRLPSIAKVMRELGESLSRIAALADRTSASSDPTARTSDDARELLLQLRSELHLYRRFAATWMGSQVDDPKLFGSVAASLAELGDLAAQLTARLIEPPNVSEGFQHVLRRSAGSWTKGNGLDYQQLVREEWEPKA